MKFNPALIERIAKNVHINMKVFIGEEQSILQEN